MKSDLNKYELVKSAIYSVYGKEYEKNIFLRDIGVKSSGFTRVAGLSMILVIGCLIIMYLLFRFQVIRVKNYILDYVNENEYKKKEKA